MSFLLNASIASLISWLQGLKSIKFSLSGIRGGEVLISKLFLLHRENIIGFMLAIRVGNKKNHS